MNVTGRFTKDLFSRDAFAIKLFKAYEPIEMPDGSMESSFSVKGVLPNTVLDITLEGEFDPMPFVSARGKQFTFSATSCEEHRVANRSGITKYLTSINGIGETLARRIYEMFGDETFDVLDDDIERLKNVQGVGKKNFELIKEDYMSRGAAKDVYAYLLPFGIGMNKIGKLYDRFGKNTIEMVKEDPYRLFMKGYFSFNIAEKIFKSLNSDSLAPNRVKGAIFHVLYNVEQLGHTYCTWANLLDNVYKLFGVEKLPKSERMPIAEKIRSACKSMEGKEIYCRTRLKDGTPIFYRAVTGYAEYNTAKEIKRIMESSPSENRSYMDDIANAEKELGILLSPEQEAAVETVMNSQFSVVTGGPGTGKTSFQKVLFNVFERFSNDGIMLAAPTGRAARRMTESSGLPSGTIHQTLGLMATDDGEFINIEDSSMIDTGLLVVDEVSMLDIYLADKLFTAISRGTKIVCVGDIYQLPSVGAGAVLKSMIDSGEVPVITFTKIFRQAGNSSIAINAARINHGIKEMDFDDSFVFIPRDSSEDIVETVKVEYAKALKEYGDDETIVLTPYRKKTATGVNEINPVLKEIINPIPSHVNGKNKVDNMDLYLGDKVMFTKNKGELTNGDIGYITKIELSGKSQIVTCDFGDDRVVELAGAELDCLVQAYACTVHKSQGAEYKCCIIIIDPKHDVLLKRNLVYTAITRAKEKVILIGDIDAYTRSIDREDTSSRNTQLDDIITLEMSK